MSNDPRTLGQSLVFQHDLVIMVHVDLQMLALIIMEKILKKKKYIYIYIIIMEKPANK